MQMRNVLYTADFINLPSGVLVLLRRKNNTSAPTNRKLRNTRQVTSSNLKNGLSLITCGVQYIFTHINPLTPSINCTVISNF